MATTTMGRKTEPLWRDREVRFDVHPGLLGLGPGEILIDSLEEVEDTKGNNGQRGKLIVTNLRIIWHTKGKLTINLSIGFGSIGSMTIHTADSRLRGTTQALYLMTTQDSKRYQFIFTHLVPQSPRLFTTVQAVRRAYESSHQYRNVTLRNAIVVDGEVTLLPHEEIYVTYDGVWNLAGDQGTLGKLIVTNIRIVWVSLANDAHNASVPYVQILFLGKQASKKFGKVFIVKTHSGTKKLPLKFPLGFRIDPEERLDKVMYKVSRLHQAAQASPIMGVYFESEEVPDESALIINPEIDDVEIVADTTNSDAFAAYYADGNKGVLRKPVFSEDLGLAVEELRGDTTLRDLWTVAS